MSILVIFKISYIFRIIDTGCPSFSLSFAVKCITLLTILVEANSDSAVKEDIRLINKFENISFPFRGKRYTIG